MEQNNSLRPCPFCGMDDVTVHKIDYDSVFGDGFYEVACGRCDIEGPGGFTSEEAIRRWNHRDKMVSKIPTFDYFNYEPILEWGKADVEYCEDFIDADGNTHIRPEYGSWTLIWPHGVMSLDFKKEDEAKARMCAALFIYMWTKGVVCEVAISCARLYSDQVTIRII